MNSADNFRSLLLTVTLQCALVSPVLAVPYASAVRNTTGTNYEFVLNEAADSVTITRDGGNEIVINNPMPGRHTFDLASFGAFEIGVAKDAALGWTEISDAENLHTYYFRPTGLAVNQDPASPYFGTVYVSHPIAIASGTPNVARGLGEGVYSLSADLVAVDLANNFAAQLEADDQALAKVPPGWTVTGNGGSSPWRLALDDGGNVIAADFSDQNGGIKYASPDLTTGGLVLAEEDGVLPLLLNSQDQEFHGSILSNPSVTGTVGVDLTVWAIDEDYDFDGDTFNIAEGEEFAQTSTYHPLRWDVGSATNYDQPPTIVINKEMLNVDDGDFTDLAYTLSPQEIGGVITNNMHYEPQFDKFYILQSRTHGNESGIFIVTADGVDGNSPVVEWSSKRFSFDNGLDGNDSTNAENPSFGEGIQDIFRNIDDLIISPDGSTMYVSRLVQFDSEDTPLDGNNPVLGADSNAPDMVLVIPLDENGLPDLIVDDNGTPGDTSDDFISNIDSIPMALPGTRSLRQQLGLDVAGNVYSVDNINERLQVFSPGGATLATTGSGGTFSVVPLLEPEGLPGDYNEDGVVNAADYVVYRNLDGQSVTLPNENPDAMTPGVVDAEDYTFWVENFGNTLGSGSSAAVPEPSSAVLLVATLLVAVCSRRTVPS